MQQPIRTIHVGVFRRGKKMLDLFHQDKSRFEPVALVDATEELACQAAEENGLSGLRGFGDLSQALSAVEADAVVITSPARFHTAQMRAALESGLHVFVAKPMTYDLEEAAGLVRLAESKGLAMVIDQQYRFSPCERKMTEWVREETYGPVGFVTYTVHRHRPRMAAFTGEEPFIWEQGVHTFDSLLAIMGRPARRVSAMSQRPPWSEYNGPTLSMGLIEFDGGIPCSVVGSFDSRAFHFEMRMEMEKAAVRFVGRKNFSRELEVALPGETFQPTGLRDSDESTPDERYNLEAFHRAIDTGERVSNDGRENLRTLALVDAFLRSAKSGQTEEVRAFDE